MIRIKKYVTVFSLPIFLCVVFVAFSMLMLSCQNDDDDDNDSASDTPTALALTNDGAVEMYNKVWPDGSKVLFAQERDDKHWDLYTVPLDGSLTKTKISPGNNTYYFPDVNPTGTQLCYATGADDLASWEIAVYQMGGSETIITSNQTTNGLDSQHPSFSGDGSQIAYVQRDWDSNTDRIVIIDADGQNEILVCTLESGAAKRVESLDWLGTTNEVIYTARNGKLYRVQASAGATPVQIGTDSVYHTCASNVEGTKILCAETAGDGQQYIEINPDGTGKRVLVVPDEFPMLGAIYCQVCWLRDGSGIVSLAEDAARTNFDYYLLTNFD
ncbi:TolB family protein [candidate division CSSED10-310 bacterium]|uniref:TolB family protein n=1 Tax=candidate division CSSED10-310 bacterium TaxID=2855610 RepID=A0ABV6Z4I6_UNCC1